MLANKLMSASADDKLFVDDLFQVVTYQGNGSTQTITNGIDLAGKGGLVWIKDRDSGAKGHALFDTSRGVNLKLQTQSTSGQFSGANQLTTFNSDGFTLGSESDPNGSGTLYVSWTFRNAYNFSQVLQVTKSAGSNLTIDLTSYMSTVGMVRVKRTDVAGSWYVWHRSLSAGKLLIGETTAAEATLGHITVVGTTLTLVNGVIADGQYHVEAYAHDTSTDGIIQCGSFTTDGSGNATVSLGWEPQFLLYKNATTASDADWTIVDQTRGWTASNTGAPIYPNLSSAEGSAASNKGRPTATGFSGTGAFAISSTYIYLAIRRPNKPPTSGTQVYQADIGAGASPGFTFPGLVADAVLYQSRVGNSGRLSSRLTGAASINTGSTNAEYSDALVNWDNSIFTHYLGSRVDHIGHAFRRAPGVMDICCYTGTGTAHTEAHNLGVVPELMIVKSRSLGTQEWAVQVLGDGTKLIKLNSTAAITTNSAYWNDVAPTTSVFTVGASGMVNSSGATYVAYLFATKTGIQKITSFVGNGTSQTIDCGFTTGARFVCIKATSTTGNWNIGDSTRGLVSGTDPLLYLNSTAAEVTTDDWLDPDNSGFVVNETASAHANTNGVTYLVWAIA